LKQSGVGVMMKFDGTEKIGDIVSQFPGAGHLFREYGIDFCCGGNRTLLTALRQKEINPESFLGRLNQAYEKANQQPDGNTDWRKAPYTDLMNHIVHHHHAYLNEELPLLGGFTTKILRVHGPKHPELAELHRLFHQLKMDLEQHLISEEEVVFPMIAVFEKTGSKQVIEKAVQAADDLESEHSETGELLKKMREVTNGYKLPEGACRTYALTFHMLERLEADLFQHIHLENNILFPRLKSEMK
jgi:regulator of cell morphogenesis and NO signaling